MAGPRAVQRAKAPFRSITSRKAVITVAVDSCSTGSGRRSRRRPPRFRLFLTNPAICRARFTPPVTQPNLMLLWQLLVEVLHVEIAILFLVLPQNLFHRR
jgi:hypothetical protein